MTRAERVLQALAVSDWDGWVCARDLIKPHVGGLRAAARVWDLKQSGVLIESATCDCRRCERAGREAKALGIVTRPFAKYRLVSREGAAA